MLLQDGKSRCQFLQERSLPLLVCLFLFLCLLNYFAELVCGHFLAVEFNFIMNSRETSKINWAKHTLLSLPRKVS